MKQEIFISYAWGDSQEKGESRENIVDLIEERVKSPERNIIRDKKDVHYKDNIKEFENRLGAGNYIILVVSDKFLKSGHCMYEVLKITEHKDVYKRIFPVVLADAKIYDKVDVLDYSDYWKKQVKRLEDRIKQTDDITYITNVVEQLRIYADIHRLIDGFSDMLAKMNTLTTLIHKETDFSALVQALEAQIKADDAIAQQSMKADSVNTARDRTGSPVYNNYGAGDMFTGNKNITNNYYHAEPKTPARDDQAEE